MKTSKFYLCIGAMLIIAGAPLSPSIAQTNAADQAMRQIASQSVGMPESAFEVLNTDTVLTIKRVNSAMNASSHQGRNNEASAIAKAVAAEFVRNAVQYSGIQSISVDYIERTGTPVHDNLVDRIDFRKNAAGRFELHIS